MLQSMGLQRAGQDLATEQQQRQQQYADVLTLGHPPGSVSQLMGRTPAFKVFPLTWCILQTYPFNLYLT